MNRLLACAALVAGAAAAVAQQQPGLPLPRIDSLSPTGARQGTVVAEVTLLGVDLDEPEGLLFAHPGIKAEPFVPEPPKVDPKDPKKKPPEPKAVTTAAKFKVTVAADVPPGQYDVRLVNKFGVSGPRTFVVGDLPEAMEKEPNNDVPEAMRIALNSTINGVVSQPTDVDFYALPASKGQRIVLACLAESIDSRARPLVEVYDESGRQLVSQSGSDSVTDFVAPADGTYLIRVAEFTYTTGGPNNFYRLTATTNPWIDAVHPPMVEPGKASPVTLYGRNLPGGTSEAGAFVDGRPLEKLVVSVTPPAETDRLAFRGRVEPRSGGTDGFEYRLKGPGGSSNAVLIGFAQEKVSIEAEGNDKADAAMAVPLPCEVAGRIDKRGDRDCYAFDAKKGQSLVIDLWADRLGIATDFVFTVRAAKSTSDMTEKDDNPDILSPTQFYNRTTDPEPFAFTAPEDGKYVVTVMSRESSYQFGPRACYRLRLGPPRPDFRIVAMPASDFAPDVTVLRGDGCNHIEVYAIRHDGFTGPIALAVEGLPAGVTCPPQVVGTNQKRGSLVLTAAPGAAKWSGPIRIKATGTIAGKPVVREARSATITWSGQPQQNQPVHSRLDGSLMLAVRDGGFFKVTAEPENAFLKAGEKLPQPLTIKQGDKLTVPFKVARISPDAKVAVTLRQVNTMTNPQQMPLTVNNGQNLPAVAPDKGDGTFVIDCKNTALPGTYAVVLTATAQIQYERPGGDKKGKRPATVEQAVTPITVIVVPVALAKVTTSQSGAIKGGTSGELVVKVDRLNGFEGEYKVKVNLPAGTKGLTADEATIPAGATEVKVPLKAAADVAAGQVQNVSVGVTGMYEGKLAIVAESNKFNLAIEKAPAPKKDEPKKK